MSSQDSFINEVTEEVRRDKLFRLMRRYGWIAVSLVVLVVGGAGALEWQRAQARAEAEAAGDALLNALEEDAPTARAEVLAAIEGDSGGRNAIVRLFQAAAEIEAGEDGRALATLEEIAVDAEAPSVYRDLAVLKSVMISDAAPEERIARLEPLTRPGNLFRLLAIEQRALAEVELGQTQTAIETLNGILADAEQTEGLRRRASWLIDALGGTPGDA
ncbi:MAG: hypothetical protein F4213_08385 [Boseongicola sp. SB0677_bin_26]|nr:hypothetical protein [Boseongicola sp. SB0665_bin_10]MYG26028.1 hypothetical protein [Boseongicola sp. SB0677_bin_26]